MNDKFDNEHDDKRALEKYGTPQTPTPPTPEAPRKPVNRVWANVANIRASEFIRFARGWSNTDLKGFHGTLSSIIYDAIKDTYEH